MPALALAAPALRSIPVGHEKAPRDGGAKGVRIAIRKPSGFSLPITDAEDHILLSIASDERVVCGDQIGPWRSIEMANYTIATAFAEEFSKGAESSRWAATSAADETRRVRMVAAVTAVVAAIMAATFAVVAWV